MKLSALKVLELNERYNLIEGLGDREQFNPEGVDLELRVGRVERIVGDSFLGISDRRFGETALIADIDAHGKSGVIIRPGDYFLVRTVEKINCPEEKVKIKWYLPHFHIIPDVKPRVSLQKAGIGLYHLSQDPRIGLYCSTTNPGYSGKLWFGMANHSRHDFIFELGARMFKVYWEIVFGDIKRAYEGQHQGGTLDASGKQN